MQSVAARTHLKCQGTLRMGRAGYVEEQPPIGRYLVRILSQRRERAVKAGHLPALSPFSASPKGNCTCFSKRYPRECESQPPSRAEHQHPGCASQILLWGTGFSPPRAPAQGSTGLWDRRRESAGDAAVTQRDGLSAKGPHRLFLVGL